ncbi:MAG TPA: glycosyltransferase N-terminal domain-containing protein [Bacteroidales bacterium]|nr:glycosyltransferase N-terminal domain-containing protein [Bacteroidales bacterium]HPT22000.1 glycosyltransferase N-terminal domain-containing protein [Bacteroidales bacterium]
MRILYNIGICLYTLLIHLISPFNSKASLWARGRKNWDEKVMGKIRPGDRTIWIHAASLGEFEQGRPVIEAIKKEKPGIKIVLTFFSPSGYEIRKNYPLADCICYLPADTPRNARRFIKLINPEYVVFVKYEFWNNYISTLYRNGIPFCLISAIFRPDQHFFKWYGTFFRNMLKKFNRIFVQDQKSFDLLSGIGLDNIQLAGDTRFDRVVQIAATAKDIPQLGQFRGNEKLFLAGSSWKPDEEIIVQYINNNPEKMKWVFAPHEIDKPNIERLEKLLKVSHVRFSEFNEKAADSRVLIIDNIGMLSSAYKYAYIAAIGGGFGKGIHNVLEPACWGIPVLFGPKYEKFKEAVDLINENGAVTFDSFDKFSVALDKWLADESFYLKSAKTTLNYINKNTGATNKILQEIFKKDINKSGS